MVDSRLTGRPLYAVAFGHRPAAAITLPPDADPTDRWLGAVALGARGRYAAAAALLYGLVTDRSAEAPVRAHACITRAAHLRQLGGHAHARGWDARGLALAAGTQLGRAHCAPAGGEATEGLDAPAAWADAMVGLAADAVGLGDQETADRLLSRVERENVKQISWRPSVRLLWVRTELALLRGHAAEARPWVERAVALAKAAGSVRHVLKSEIISTVIDSSTSAPSTTLVNTLNALVERAAAAKLASLEWVIFGLLADQVADSDPIGAARFRDSGLAVLRKIRLSAEPIGRTVFDRSPWVPNLGDSPLLHSENL